MKGGTYPTLTTLNRSNGPYNLSSRPVISQSTLRDSIVTSNNNGKINNHNNNYNQTAVQNNMINNNINEYKITKSDLNTLKNEIIDKVRTELDDKLQSGMNTLLTKVFEMCDNIYKLNQQLNAILNENEQKKSHNMSSSSESKSFYNYDTYDPPDEYQQLDAEEIELIIKTVAIPALLGSIYDEKSKVRPIL
jgi:hypothetical protein